MEVRLYEQIKPEKLKKVSFGGAPRLDEEYGTTVTPKEGCDEHSVGAVRRGYSSSNIRGGN
jgi:hypothetical protein